MIWAIKDNEKIKAIPKQKAICTLCGEEVISKCGGIKIWHWAHKSGTECDYFKEPETEWHIKWKEYFPKEQQEVVMENHRADIITKNKLIIEFQNSPISIQQIKEREHFYDNMVWVINGKTFAKNFILKKNNLKNYYTFRWKHPPKSWWNAKKPIYIDFEENIHSLKKELKNYKEGGKKSYKSSSYPSYEWEDAYGNIHERDCAFWETESYDNTFYEINELKKQINFKKNNLFLLKKVYSNTPCGGWGVLIPKKTFIIQNGGNCFKDGEKEISPD